MRSRPHATNAPRPSRNIGNAQASDAPRRRPPALSPVRTAAPVPAAPRPKARSRAVRPATPGTARPLTPGAPAHRRPSGAARRCEAHARCPDHAPRGQTANPCPGAHHPGTATPPPDDRGSPARRRTRPPSAGSLHRPATPGTPAPARPIGHRRAAIEPRGRHKAGPDPRAVLAARPGAVLAPTCIPASPGHDPETCFRVQVRCCGQAPHPPP